uniref:HNH domain-containing protein n=1 Tax=Fagus sylvatica TaxID=28930 RepID=A0A2N9EQJ7_FAGSY
MSTTSSSSSSPHRSRGKSNGEERPRFFDSKVKSKCWADAEIIPGRHPERWRKDAAGNVVCKRFCNCQGCLCFEYDHIVPFSKGGESTAGNCQILQTRVNRLKSGKDNVDPTQLKGYSCDVKFTVHQVTKSLSLNRSTLNGMIAFIPTEYKELDIIEMAVYGDVVRPGNQCRCRTIAEMLGQYKPKDHVAACKLPYNDESS